MDMRISYIREMAGNNDDGGVSYHDHLFPLMKFVMHVVSSICSYKRKDSLSMCITPLTRIILWEKKNLLQINHVLYLI